MSEHITITNNGISYTYSESITPNSLGVVQKTVERVQNSSNKNKNFFNNLKLEVYGYWDESTDEDIKNTSYYTKGFVIDPIAGYGKKIYLIANKSLKHDLTALYSKEITSEKLKATTLHELGHVFDFYFSNYNNNLQQYLTLLCTDGDYLDDEFLELYSEYKKNNGVSDSAEFKEAWKNDVEANFKGKNWFSRFFKTLELKYFSPTWNYGYIGDKGSKITLEDGINDTEVEHADGARSEVFAQLVAYALGAEDNQKDIILKSYPQCYEVVKANLEKCLGISTQEKQKNLNIEM